ATTTTNPSLAVTSTSTGSQGNYTFGNRQPINFQQIETFTPLAADLSVTKTDSPDPASAGGNLTYTLTVTNGGASDAISVTLTDPLPANTTFVSLTAPAGWAATVPP